MKVDIKMHQFPFKNVTASYDDYTAYTGRVGSDDKLAPYITLYVDRSGYISHMVLQGYMKNLDNSAPEKIFGGAMALCVMMCGVNNMELGDWGLSAPEILFRGSGSTSKIWSSLKNKYIHVDSRMTGTVGKYRVYAVHIYGATE